MSPHTTADVVVVGGGPAGRAAARACARRGLAVTLVDPRPHAPWPQTFGMWEHELPADLPPSVVAARGVGTAHAVHEHVLEDRYVVLRTPALQAHLDHPDVVVRTGRVVGVEAGPAAVLADGTRVRGRVVLDGSGARQILSRRRRTRRVAAEQTAYGVIVDDATAARVTAGRLVFMDWRPRHGVPGRPTFLYAVPLGPDRVLLEETSLAARPAMTLPELRDRLRRRLVAHGLDPDPVDDGDPARVERVRFPVDRPWHRPPPGVVPIGAAAPLVHPASGFSLAASLATAPRVAEAIAHDPADGRTGYRVDAAVSPRRVILSPSAFAVDRMRRRGLDVLLRMPPARVPAFFDRFFALPAHRRRAYLGVRDDVPTTLAAMVAVFAHLDPDLRLHLIAGTMLGPGCARMGYPR